MKLLITFLFSVVFIYSSAQNFSWTAQTSGVSDNFRDVHFSDNQNGWAVGQNGVIVHTTDGGQNWNTQTSNTSEVLRAVHFTDAANGWISGGLNNPVLLKTTDSGSTWQTVNYPGTFAQLRDVRFRNNSIGWLLDTDSIYHTTDGGNTWIKENVSSSISDGLSVNAIATTSDSTAYVCGRYNRTPTTKAAVFDNFMFPQNPWTADGVNSFHADDVIRVIEFSNYYTGYCGGEQGIVYRMKSDSIFFNGPWEKLITVGSANTIIYSISFPIEKSGMFNISTTVGATNYAVIFHTNSYGDQWSVVPDSIPDLGGGYLNAPDDMTAWIVGNFGKIYKGVRFSTGIENKLQKNLAFTISPNPFLDEINIQFDYPMESVSLDILNVLGKQVWHSDHEILNTNFSISGLNNLETGIYYLRITDRNSGLISTKKIVKK